MCFGATNHAQADENFVYSMSTLFSSKLLVDFHIDRAVWRQSMENIQLTVAYLRWIKGSVEGSTTIH